MPYLNSAFACSTRTAGPRCRQRHLADALDLRQKPAAGSRRGVEHLAAVWVSGSGQDHKAVS
jgi:hypothetical protein